MNSRCDDGLVCNGAETCNLATNVCEFGIELVCSGAPDSCSLDDTCQAGSVDGDGICGADDDCPTDANPGQADLDGDGDGDVCDASDALLNVTRARAKRDSSLNPSKPNGLVKASVDLIVDLPGGDVLSAASGLAIRVVDALNLDTDDLMNPPAGLDGGNVHAEVPSHQRRAADAAVQVCRQELHRHVPGGEPGGRFTAAGLQVQDHAATGRDRGTVRRAGLGDAVAGRRRTARARSTTASRTRPGSAAGRAERQIRSSRGGRRSSPRLDLR